MTPKTTPTYSDATTIRIDDDLALEVPRDELRRLLVRVMCELIAYNENEAAPLT